MYMLLHAFGHAFGFGHTPESPGDKGDGSYIEGTAEYDPASIMVREADPLRWSGFSENDIKPSRPYIPPTSRNRSRSRNRKSISATGPWNG